MQDYLRAKGHWFWIHNPVPPATDPKNRLKCMMSRDEAVGKIRRHITAELRSIATDAEDPQTILNSIKEESSESIPAPPAVHSTSSNSSSGSTRTYSLQDADKELLIAVLLRGTKYTALTTSLLAQPELSIQQVEDALKNEEAHRLGVAAAAALSPVSNLAAPAVGSTCAFCGRSGHTVELCFKFRDASKAAKEQVQELAPKSGGRRR